MIHPKIDVLLDQVDSKYGLVLAAAKRARQINDYHHQLGEGGLNDYAPPLVESRSKNFLTMAFEEISDRKLLVTYPQRRVVRGGAAQAAVPPEASGPPA
jgi:DNA-directed RNA polymerase subunit omega